MQQREKPTVRAHRELGAVLRAGDTAVDATAGNGHDTAFLASMVGRSGRVLAFDIQPEAIASSKRKIETFAWNHVQFVLACHSTLADHVPPERAAAIVFNLGYLPGGDHALITASATTLIALRAAAQLLRPSGLLTIVCYPGHEGGDAESAAVIDWAQALSPAAFEVEVDRPEELLRTSPFLILVRKRSL